MSAFVKKLFADQKYACGDIVEHVLASKLSFHGDEQALDVVVKHAESQLSTVSTRYEGLRSLSFVFRQLDSVTFVRVCPTFVHSCIASLSVESTGYEERKISYKLLCQMFQRVYEGSFQELTRDLSLPVSKFIQGFTQKCPAEDVLLYSKFLEVCCKCFSVVMHSKKDLTGSLIMDYVGELSKQDFKFSAGPLKMLAKTYAKILMSGNSKARFTDALGQLMEMFLAYLDVYSLFSMRVPTPNFFFYNGDVTELYKEVQDRVLDPMINMKRLYFLSHCICYVLEEPLSIPAVIPVLAMLTSFKAFTTLFKYKSTEDKCCDHVIPQVFENIFRIMKSLVEVGRSNLLEYSKEIKFIVRLTVDWLGQIDGRSLLELRESFFTFLLAYFDVLGVKVNFDTGDIHSILKCLFESVKIMDSSVRIQLSQPQQKQTKKNAAPIHGHVGLDRKALVRSTSLAIQILNSILRSGVLILDKNNIEGYTGVESMTINTLLEIYKNWIRLPYPYQDSSCRAQLLDTLSLTIQNAPDGYNPPLELGQSIFGYCARIDSSPEVRVSIANFKLLSGSILNSRLFHYDAPPRLLEPEDLKTGGVSMCTQTEGQQTSMGEGKSSSIVDSSFVNEMKNQMQNWLDTLSSSSTLSNAPSQENSIEHNEPNTKCDIQEMLKPLETRIEQCLTPDIEDTPMEKPLTQNHTELDNSEAKPEPAMLEIPSFDVEEHFQAIQLPETSQKPEPEPEKPSEDVQKIIDCIVID